MASEIGMKIAKHALVAHAQGRLDDPYQKALNDMAGESDRELQEVRDVLEGLAIRKDFGDGQPCWCYKTQWDASPADDPHASSCQRARALADHLRV